MESDVYSFGVVLLQLISGQTEMVRLDNLLYYRGKIKGIVDPRLNGDLNINSVREAVETAKSCVESRPNKRPAMSFIVPKLKECLSCLEISAGNYVEDDCLEMTTSYVEDDCLEITTSYAEVTTGSITILHQGR